MSQEKVAEVIDLNASRKAAEAGEETAGDFLANARRSAGLDLAAVSAEIKVKPEHLEAIEAVDASRLPATPYAVGFVKVYARFLGLDAEAVAAHFKSDIGAAGAFEPALAAARDSGAGAEIPPGAKLASIFGVVAIVVFMIWAAIQVAGNAERRTADAAREPGGPGVVVKNAQEPAPKPRAVEPRAVSVVTEEVAPLGDTAGPADAGTASQDSITLSDANMQEPDANAEPAGAPAAVSPIAAQDVAEDERRAAPALRDGPETPEIIGAQLTRSIAPRYPSACDRDAADIEKVLVVFDITAQGRTANARVVSSTNACFNEAALAALQRWRFDPKTINGAARPDIGKKATLNFRK